MRASFVTLAAMTILCPATAALAGSVSLTGLGDLPGLDTYSIARAVNADGSVIVGYSIGANGGQAFRWTQSTGMVGLDYLPQGDRSDAFGVTASGAAVVGAATTPDQRGDKLDRGTRWNAAGTPTDLGFAGQAWGTNHDGSVIVGDNGIRAVRYTAANGAVALGELNTTTNGTPQSHAAGVSGDGKIVVGQSSSNDGFRAVRWTQSGGPQVLGDLHTSPQFNSAAGAANTDGSVIVGTDFAASEAFRWTEATGTVGLGHLPGTPSTYRTTATDLSADGKTIVGAGYNGGTDDSSLDYDAIVWTQEFGGFRKLWDILSAAGVDPAADGWTSLNEAWGISDDGSTVVGDGIRNGHTEAFSARIADPSPTHAVPLPAAVWSAGSLLTAIAGRRALRRRRRV